MDSIYMVICSSRLVVGSFCMVIYSGYMVMSCIVVVVCIALVFMIGFYLMLERFTGTVLNMCSIVVSFVERIAQLNYGK
ncbi:hypothetical protein BZG01_17225 [Labilibaculum manganireducens]|uniref:Uncharacterized protein n=2 Tax=Labilibaculum manganireducens TaxID=1940525 RepID=A0A2N3HX75_9BACT|nr:hypothetical protein BZG01_17225 [Labilibaculum manganireducens]